MPKLKLHTQSAPGDHTQGNHERLIHEEALTRIALALFNERLDAPSAEAMNEDRKCSPLKGKVPNHQVPAAI